MARTSLVRAGRTVRSSDAPDAPAAAGDPGAVGMPDAAGGVVSEVSATVRSVAARGAVGCAVPTGRGRLAGPAAADPRTQAGGPPPQG